MNNVDLKITKYLLGTIDFKEKKELIEWISKNKENKKYFSEIESLFNTIEVIRNPDNIDPENTWNNIKDKLSKNKKYDIYSTKSVKNKQHSPFNYKKLLIAAIIIISIGLSFTITYLIFLNKTNNQVAINEIVVPKGSKSSITLNDGSKIWINSQSKLKYPIKFNSKQREIYLDGEAFFKVAKDAKRPFYVKTSDLDIKVLGTSFNVKSYANEGTIETTLVEGSVSINKKGTKAESKDVILKPNQRLIYIKKKGKILIDDIRLQDQDNNKITKEIKERTPMLYLDKNIEPKVYTSWKDNKLIFIDESFESLAIKMERWYNVKIIIKGEKLKNFRFTGTFENETVDQAFKALQLTTPFIYSIDQNIITIEY